MQNTDLDRRALREGTSRRPGQQAGGNEACPHHRSQVHPALLFLRRNTPAESGKEREPCQTPASGRDKFQLVIRTKAPPASTMPPSARNPKSPRTRLTTQPSPKPRP